MGDLVGDGCWWHVVQSGDSRFREIFPLEMRPAMQTDDPGRVHPAARALPGHLVFR